jgi:carboxymethylenebutenolidase
MVVTAESIDVAVGKGRMRTVITLPTRSGVYPGIVCYSDIFQLTGPHLRLCTRLAGYGFVVAAPEIYHRIEPAGSALPFDDSGRARGLNDAQRTPVAHFDEDCRAALAALAGHPRVARGQLGAVGFCIGGHLAFRAALQSNVRATVCFYPTGLHNGELGQDTDAGSLERAQEIRGDLLLVFGTNDPHIAADGRAKIEQALRAAQVRVETLLFPAEHAFMRDEGPRYDPECTDQAFGAAVTFLRRVFA